MEEITYPFYSVIDLANSIPTSNKEKASSSFV